MPTPDGVALATHRWDPASSREPRATVLIAHGYAEHAGRYDALAAALTGAGFAVAALDHRGHGASGGRRADIERFGLLVDDFAAFARAEAPESARRAVFGHSMGGAIALGYAARVGTELAALVVSSAFLRSAVPSPPWLEPVARVLARIAPQLPVQRLDSADLSRLPDEVRAYDEDPLVYRRPVKARMALQLLAGGRAALASAATIDAPTLIVHGGADAVAHPDGSRALAAVMGDRAELKIYDGGYHELLNDRDRERVLADVVAWLEARFADS